MVIEELLTSHSAMRKPLYMTVFGIVLCSVALFSSYLIFPEHASILTIAFISIGATVIMHNTFIETEELDEKIRTKTAIHPELVRMYVFFFIGLIISFSFWYAVLPEEPTDVCLLENQICINNVSNNTFFKEQNKTLGQIDQLRARLTGQATGMVSGTSACEQDALCWFNIIFLNNLEVLVLALFFSFLYGAGAIFLIAWNASVIAVVIGQSILAENHFQFIGLLPHGIPELVSYFAAAIAGGLLSAAIVKGAIQRRSFFHIFDEVILFIIIAAASLLAGALIEALAITGEQTLAPIISVLYLVGLLWFLIRMKNQPVPNVSNRLLNK
ncbi:MAG: stage II sporulation protein M [Candidatus Diapherotrites archaeon]|nr:stage II sporulation protein M [Candidatus Diapherotrites archaeon]